MPAAPPSKKRNLAPKPKASSSKLAASGWEQVDSDEASDIGGISTDDGEEGFYEDEDEDELKPPREEDLEKEPSAGVAQYFDSEDDQEDDSDEADTDESDEEGDDDDDDDDDDVVKEKQIRAKMANLPFAALVKARKSMAQASSPDDGDDGQSGSEPESGPARPLTPAEKRAQVKEQLEGMRRGGGGGKDGERERRARERAFIEGRDNKHAPTEMSSRKPVSRRRQVVEVHNVQRRDPRFSSLSAGAANSGLFKASYGFLDSQQSAEVSMLRQTLRSLRKAEANHAGPKAKSEAARKIREEREKVERTLKREEAKENERRRRQREADVVRAKKKEIEERVKDGGKRFFLKKSAQKELILADKFARLSGQQTGPSSSSSGAAQASSSSSAAGAAGAPSRGALRKALERRRKKNAAKERKDMPSFLGGGGGGGGGGRGGVAGAAGGDGGSSGLAPAPKPKRLREGGRDQSRFAGGRGAGGGGAKRRRSES